MYQEPKVSLREHTNLLKDYSNLARDNKSLREEVLFLTNLVKKYEEALFGNKEIERNEGKRVER